jgi:hypothetical protein
MLSDLRFAFRSLAKSPGFTAAALLVVALGIGAATAMFSAVNALILRPIALPEPERLVAIYETNLARDLPYFSVSFPNYLDWKNRSTSWESLVAWRWRAMNLTGVGEPELVQVRAVTANFLPSLGIPTVRGRNFSAEEDQPGGAHVAIISETFCQRQFGNVQNILGRTLTFDGTPYTIIGITPAAQPAPAKFEVAIPYAADPVRENRENHETEVYGRLKRGVTIEQANTELSAIAS